MLKTPIGKLCYRFFVLLISIMYFWTPYAKPTKGMPIEPLDEDTVQLSFAAIADPQVSSYLLRRVPYFDATCDDLKNAAVMPDAVLIAGDVAENGLAIEYEYIYQHMKDLNTRFILAEGNHDIRLRLYAQSLDRFSSLANALNQDEAMNSFYYAEEINGYTFLILGSERSEFEENYLSSKQLNWLDAQLAAQNGKPCFVVCHQPLKDTHGLPDTWGSPFQWTGTVGPQSDKLSEILHRYRNVIFITGHLHTGVGEFTFEQSGDLWMVNLPSLCVKNKDGEYNYNGVGCIVECYEDRIVFRVRDFGKGIWIRPLDYVIPVK